MEHDFIVINDSDETGRSTSDFAARLAQSMIAPLRRRIDYQGLARKIFVVDQLPQGALPIYSVSPPEEEDV